MYVLVHIEHKYPYKFNIKKREEKNYNLYCYVRLVNILLLTLPITFKFIANILADYNPNKIKIKNKKKEKTKKKLLFILHIKHQK